jgi:hypothetical protein
MKSHEIRTWLSFLCLVHSSLPIAGFLRRPLLDEFPPGDVGLGGLSPGEPPVTAWTAWAACCSCWAVRSSVGEPSGRLCTAAGVACKATALN